MDPRRLIPALALVAVVCVVATVAVAVLRGGSEDPSDRIRSSEAQQSDTPASILAGWDERRSAAWAEGDADALRALYVDGSRSGRADVRLLRRWAERGLRVRGLITQVLSLDVVSRSEGRLRLLVTDRVAGGEAVGRGQPVLLPVDRASTRRIDLVQVEGEWLVDEVRDQPGSPQPSAAASTSRTSSSSKS